MPPNFGYNSPQKCCLSCYQKVKAYNQATGANMSNRKKFSKSIMCKD